MITESAYWRCSIADCPRPTLNILSGSQSVPRLLEAIDAHYSEHHPALPAPNAPQITVTRTDEAHACPMCPTVVRSLFATAHNAVVANPAGAQVPDWPRFARKLDELRTEVEALQPMVDAHFAATRGPSFRYDPDPEGS